MASVESTTRTTPPNPLKVRVMMEEMEAKEIKGEQEGDGGEGEKWR